MLLQQIQAKEVTKHNFDQSLENDAFADSVCRWEIQLIATCRSAQIPEIKSNFQILRVVQCNFHLIFFDIEMTRQLLDLELFRTTFLILYELIDTFLEDSIIINCMME